MTNEPLPKPDELAHPDEFPLQDEVDLTNLAEREAVNVESEVTAEDLSSEDLINNGLLPEDIEQDNVGYREFQADMEEPRRSDTIEDRIKQEVPEEGFDVVPEQRREG